MASAPVRFLPTRMRLPQACQGCIADCENKVIVADLRRLKPTAPVWIMGESGGRQAWAVEHEPWIMDSGSRVTGARSVRPQDRDGPSSPSHAAGSGVLTVALQVGPKPPRPPRRARQPDGADSALWESTRFGSDRSAIPVMIHITLLQVRSVDQGRAKTLTATNALPGKRLARLSLSWPVAQERVQTRTQVAGVSGVDDGTALRCDGVDGVKLGPRAERVVVVVVVVVRRKEVWLACQSLTT